MENREKLVQVGRGFCMGCADVIPGVSGGTVALILGIYEELIASIKLVDVTFVRALFTGAFWKLLLTAAWGRLPEAKSPLEKRVKAALFVGFLVVGIAAAIIAAAGIVTYCRDNYPEQTRGLFMGLVAASLLVPLRRMESRGTTQWVCFAAMGIGTYVLLGLGGISAESPPLWYVSATGAIAICAMILPGISGAFILLMLGTYGFVLGQVKAFVYDQQLAAVLPIGLFILGMMAGIMAFSRLLHFLLSKYHDTTMAGLLGLMLGSLRVLWPFKEQTADAARVEFMANRLPSLSESGLIPTIITFLVGIGLVVALDRVGSRYAKDES